MIKQLNNIIFRLFLLTAAWEDSCKKSISIWVFIIAGAAGFALCVLQRQDPVSRLTSCLVGFALLAVSKMTRESVGTGDGCFFLTSGLFLPVLFNLKLLLYGLSLSGVFCGLFFLVNRLKGIDVGKEKIPFIPFLVPVWLLLVMR